MKRQHDMPFGTRLADNETEFRLWAPAARTVDVEVLGRSTHALTRTHDRWFSTTLPHNLAGCRYSFVIDGSDTVPDPASRFQPEGPFGPGEIIDPSAYEWRDTAWRGRPWHEAVLYELHVGAFTDEGTFRAAIGKLDHLASLGVTAIEIMPIGEFSGARNWGYDGVDLFAIESCYGRPDDLKALVEAAHARGLMVIQDVVWNHFGPEGNFLGRYAPRFFTDAHKTPWGAAINFDRAGSAVIRDFYRHHALYWLDEFNIDGLRLDAIHAINDNSRPSIFEEIAKAVREASGDRHFHLIAENEHNQARLLARDDDRRPRIFTAQWNDDFHHAIHVIATGEHDRYYADFADHPIERLGRSLAEGFAYQGDNSSYHGAPRGEPSADLPPTAFISFIQNHDQIGNRPLGDRLAGRTDPAILRAVAAILLLSPQIPMLFMGEEWGSERPFPFFCDVSSSLGDIIRRSRLAEIARGEKYAAPAALAQLPDPTEESTFVTAKLDWRSIDDPDHAAWLALHHHLLTLRRSAIVPLLPSFAGNAGQYAVMHETMLHVGWTTSAGVELRLTTNLGSEARACDPDRGCVIYESHSRPVADVAPPWFVGWRIS